jgi:mannose/cellobiose epimerase-like protein (N-acyl-D-glucosamine 2-epimerase family)
MEVKLAGMSLKELRQSLHDELFNVFLPFWDRHGVDHEYGGVMCGLDYDGTLVNTGKLLWFQGRAIWIYSFLYNHLDKNPRYLEIARQAKDFVLKHAWQADGWWAEKLTREGNVLKPYSGDTEGMYFIVEGFQEYAAATGDEQARDIAFALLNKLFQHFDSSDFRYLGADFPYLWESKQAVRPQGLWMVIVYIAAQILSRWKNPEILTMADRAIDAIMNKHYNPAIGLNTEALFFDFTRPEGEEQKSRIGHSIESFWMVMEEATRRGDQALWDTCAERVHRHLNVGWDHVYGGVCEWVNVDQGGYVWPPEMPVGTDLEFRYVGEYHYMKALWALNEAMVATLNIYERTGAEWAARYFAMSYKLLNEKFSQKSRGLPGYMLFANRRMTPQPHVARQDNYHPPRQLMLNILSLDRMIQREDSRQ